MSLVVSPFLDETYPGSVAFMTIHLSDGIYSSNFGNTRRNAYYPGSMYIPDAIFDGGVDHFVGYPGIPPTPWTNIMDARLAIPTDVTIDIIPTMITPEQWSFTADVCMEPTGTARTVAVYIAYTVDDYPDTYPYRYRKNLREGYGPEAVDLVPAACVQVETTFTFTSVALDRWAGTEVVAWAQTPVSGWGEVYQAATLSMTLLADGFESGDLTGWTVVDP